MDFHGQMVLFRWALGQLGVEDLADFKKRFQVSPDSPGGIDERTGLHRFYETIAGALPTVGDGKVLSLDRLQEYEQNILEHTQAINTARVRHGQPAIEWMYHQYLALLFTEMFLDRYFADAAGLRDEINGVIAAHNDRLGDATHPDWVAPYPTEPTGDDDGDPKNQLSRLAFWCATGSGKTLLMHMHIRQFRRHHGRANRENWPALDQIILVTPNDGLSDQHAQELTWAGFEVVEVGEAGVDGLFSDQARKAIKILSIHKFRDDHGKATVATEAFEGCNLVLVDEGHRGAGAGGEGAWLSRRNQLAEGGFTFEYSATFKEAVQGDEAMRVQYARSILFDYAYRSFYRDGYGKDFTILNLEDDDKQTRYLTAALLLFYQQMRVWMDGGERIKPFRIDKPLWVFVGHTVTGGKVSTKDDKVSVSDVVEVLLFVKRFLDDPARAVELIRSLLDEGMVDNVGRDLLANRLPHLDLSGDHAALARELHGGILRDVFHAPGGGSLTVQLFREAAGELALRVGEGEPFGVVNVGEPGVVAEACEAKGVTRLEDDVNRASLFKGINRDDSTINLLVGSRKFTEGWNSWRVSSIGLMNMGKGEGTQIIQLFGRGVRLRGYRMSLRRSSVLTEKPPTPKNLRQVETLQVFGIKASYMNQFRDWIFSEVPEAQERQVWDLPVVKTLPERRLRTLRLRDTIDGVQVERGQAFRKLGPIVRLRPPSEAENRDRWLLRHPTRLNWLPRIRGIRGEQKDITAALGEAGDLPEATLKRIPIWFFDVDALLFGLEAFKATRGLDRLHADRAAIRALLGTDHWYTLHATEADMRLDRYENREQWQRMAQQLINAYAERFYRFIRGRWEAPYLEVGDVDADDPSMINSYTIETTDLVQSAEDIKRLADFVNELKEAVASDPLASWRKTWWRTVPFPGHLYQPLLYVGKNAQIRMSPVALNKWEARFVDDLAEWCRANGEGLDVYLLRNQAVTGLGFFQASNFFPDFLLWVVREDAEHLAFVDPKGLHYFDPGDPKVRFATLEIPRLQVIVERQCADLRLHAFILSNTPFASLGWSKEDGSQMSKAEVERLGIMFQVDDAADYVERMMGAVLTGFVADA
ncbi:MAG: DEAD/DEAH box helicase [Planctomycetota bacterium]|nr:MAG: DEAD/DEAH box helicase [Planctomycetota bacterium]